MNLKIFQKTRTSVYFWIGLLIFIVAEVRFDVVEIIIGRYMLLTNPLRPRVGRLWSEEKKDLSGLQQVSTLASEMKPDTSFVNHITHFQQLQDVLSNQNVVVLSRDDFLAMYRSLSSTQAKKLINPLTLYDLSRNKNWVTVKFVLNNRQLAIYFLDGFEQPLFENYIDLQQFQSSATDQAASMLDEDARYAGRIVTAETFFNAFDRLPNVYRLQIINDPKKLIDWQAGLRRVGISAFAENGTVTLAFEVIQGNRIQIFEMQASEIAAGYLIQAINSLGVGAPLALPQSKGEEE